MVSWELVMEKAVFGLQAARGCGWRGVELSTQVPGSPRGTTWPLHSQGVLVSLAVEKSHHRPSGLNNRHLFLTVLGAEKCKVKVKVDSDPEASS